RVAPPLPRLAARPDAGELVVADPLPRLDVPAGVAPARRHPRQLADLPADRADLVLVRALPPHDHVAAALVVGVERHRGEPPVLPLRLAGRPRGVGIAEDVAGRDDVDGEAFGLGALAEDAEPVVDGARLPAGVGEDGAARGLGARLPELPLQDAEEEAGGLDAGAEGEDAEGEPLLGV